MKIKVKVKPNSKQQKIETTDDGSLVIRVKSPPVDGKANEELIAIVAEKYRVAKSQVKIKTGVTGNNKLIEVN